MPSCMTCGWNAETATGQFCPRCGTTLSTPQTDLAAPPASAPIHIEGRHRLINPLFLFSAMILIFGAVVAGTTNQAMIGWILVTFGVPLLVFSVVHSRHHER